MWSLCSISIVLLCMLMCVCRILIKITYLLTYLLNCWLYVVNCMHWIGAPSAIITAFTELWSTCRLDSELCGALPCRTSNILLMLMLGSLLQPFFWCYPQKCLLFGNRKVFSARANCSDLSDTFGMSGGSLYQWFGPDTEKPRRPNLSAHQRRYAVWTGFALTLSTSGVASKRPRRCATDSGSSILNTLKTMECRMWNTAGE